MSALRSCSTSLYIPAAAVAISQMATLLSIVPSSATTSSSSATSPPYAPDPTTTSFSLSSTTSITYSQTARPIPAIKSSLIEDPPNGIHGRWTYYLF
jgi:hypothetical protein